jgi:hypothetical protein
MTAHRVVVLVALTLCASAASAQERNALKLPAALLLTAGAADISSTMFIASQNARYAPGVYNEHNPIINWMEPTIGTGPMVAIGAAAEIGAFALACLKWCDTHPKLMKWAMLIAGGAHGTAFTTNMQSHRDAVAARRRLGIR